MDTAPDPQLGSNVYEVVGIAVPSEVNTRISDVMVYYMLQIYSRDGGNLTSNKKHVLVAHGYLLSNHAQQDNDFLTWGLLGGGCPEMIEDGPILHFKD